MIAFWISAALISAAAAVLIIHRSAKVARAPVAGDPGVAVYRRQLSEIDDLAARGLLADGERRSAHAEAARRLLAAADQPEPPEAPRNRGRIAVALVAGIAPLAAITIYLGVGAPGTPDQPFARRLAQWRSADPTSLGPDQMAAVLQRITRDRPTDPLAFYYLSRAQLASGDPYSAGQSLQSAIALAPNRADLWIALGETYAAQDQGQIGPEAEAAFRKAVALDPAAPGPRYFLARAQIAGGDVDGGLAAWRALDRDLPAKDTRRAVLEREIAQVERTRGLPAAAGAQASNAPPAGQAAFIRSMVAGLAARLKANPDDPQGWARLVRSYAVLGDQPSQAAALARAQVLFKNRPNDLRLVEEAAASPQ
jgi:cytochrome c-type biogenesis protein CcmH